ncbi:MAG: PhoH family protein [Candidatus Dadabacteria bacterium]|nr:PhoH family protein [Candidatus Dadabacteria bacterium]MYA47971.1 PhoH family protein [Candidatus Dadabacteria bacterium]MYG82842.1 PhoH family protein [Candidatus Dadabacteria bacterium]MYK49159.1 PhoH family protein [Candidatus Dadabacteria bacterium]
MDGIRELELENIEAVKVLYGELNSNLKEIENEFDISIHTRGNKITLKGDEERTAEAGMLMGQMYSLIEKGYILQPSDIKIAKRLLNQKDASLEEIFLDTVCISVRKKIISPKTINQKLYIDAIRRNDMVFGIGPAGTGKTYLAMAMAVSAFTNKKVNRIVLARPAVEAGEKLGFLPGDLQEKVNPYLRPLFDALYDMMEFEKANRLIEKNMIEIVPIAYMRGRTLNDAFIILDEAQNTTAIQMKMFLTRLGFGSKAVITGDITQIDLAREQNSGLIEAMNILSGIKGIDFVHFSKTDVIRHPLVMKIIDAYEKIKDNLGNRTPATGENE